MQLVREGMKPIERVSEKQLRYYLGLKRVGDTRFVILNDGAGSYIQMLGGGIGCCLEWHDYTSRRHWRALNNPSKVPWLKESFLGQMRLQPEEYLFIDQVTEAFVAFLHNSDFPGTLEWRDVTASLEERGMQWDLRTVRSLDDG